MAGFRHNLGCFFAVVSTTIIISACGGGSDSPDTTPDVFEFESAVNVEVGGTATSNEIIIAGLTGDASLSISGGSYSFDGETYSTEDTTIANEGTIRLRGVASSEFDTTTAVTLNIGGIEGTFSITTEQEDTTPDSFDLGADETSSTPGEWVESDLITVQGINSAASISVANGEFYIVGVDTYPSSATSVENGQQISVRVQAGATLGDSETATLTIGAVSDSFSVTMVDGTPPVANVQFPTPNTLSDANFVTLRGQAEDDFGPVTSIQVVVTTNNGETVVESHTLTPGEEDNFQTTWSQRVTLIEDTVNTITVSAIDNAGNVQAEPQVLTVTQSTTDINFPVGNEVYLDDITSSNLSLSQAGDKIMLATNEADAAFTVDITSGNRDLFADLSGLSMTSPNPRTFTELRNGSLLMSEVDSSTIYVSDWESKSFSPLSDASTENSDVSISNPTEICQGDDGTVYIVDGFNYFYSLDLSTGSRSLISGELRPEGGNFPLDAPRDFILDESNGRALLVNGRSYELLWVNLETGERDLFIDFSAEEKNISFIAKSGQNQALIMERDIPDINGYGALYLVNLSDGGLNLLSDDTAPGSENSLRYPSGLAVDSQKQIAFVGSNEDIFSSNSAIRVVDITTGERITLTNSVQ